MTVDRESLRSPLPAERGLLGEWGEVISWPHIPVSAANLPDGRVLSWASWKEDDFGSGPAQTVAHVWEPATNTFTEVPNSFHDMFCAGVSILEDGRVVASGGGETVRTTSTFDFASNTWARHEDMNQSRWYNTSLLLPDGKVMTALGKSYAYPEVWTPGDGWNELEGINLGDAVLDYTSYENAKNWPFLHVAPSGELFHSGPTPAIHLFDTEGDGSMTVLGDRLESGDWYPKDGTFVMYDEGKLLITGGRTSDTNSAATARALVVDLNGPTPVVTPILPMHFPRSFHKMVPLPSGEVLIVGGNTTSLRFSDSDSIYSPEIFDPETLSFRTVSDHAVPRNYHSIALLLADGRVLSGGGGLCGDGCPSNHQDGQLLTPHYLFDEAGDLAPRPMIDLAPETIDPGQDFTVEGSEGLAGFRLIRMSAQTHGVNTGVRSLPVPFVETGSGRYRLSAPASSAVLLPGYWMLFAIDDDGVPSIAATVRARRIGVPLLFSPGNQESVVGDQVSLEIIATSPDYDSLNFSAAGLPSGLSIDAPIGDITGTLTETGGFTVTLTVTEGSGDQSTVFFTWRVTDDGFLNGPPILQWPGDQSSVEEQFVSLQLIATDPDGDFISFSEDGLPPGLAVGLDGRISGTPSEPGFFRAVIVAYDGRGQSSRTAFSWTIESAGTNDPPELADPEDQNHGEGDAVFVVLDGSDPDGDALTYTATGLPPGVLIEAGANAITGSPLPGAAGFYTATLTVSDGEFDDSQELDWEVTGARGSWIDFDDESGFRLAVGGDVADGEKDVAQGDLDRDGWIDLVVVRKRAFDQIGAQQDLLLMNRSGVLTDETALYAPGFLLDPTDARDVLVLDVDADGWLDVVIAATFDELPRLYRNLGLDLAGEWLGLADESSSRLPAGYDTDTVQFCGVTSGDLDGDGSPDLYFSNYRFDGGADDVLLINDGSGRFVEQSQERLGALRRSAFGTAVQILDMDGDGDQDIVKLSSEYAVQPWGNDGIFLLFNDGDGTFSAWDEIPTISPYMQRVADLNQDGLWDLFVQDDGQDYVSIGTGFVPDVSYSFSQLALTSARTYGHGGNFRFADLDGDGDLDVGIADVDSMFPPCDTGESDLRKLALLENSGQASGQMIDPWGGAGLVWSENTFDFEFVDIDRDGNLDVFAAQCSGYAVYRNSALVLNSPPEFAAPGDQVSEEGEFVSLILSAVDPDGDSIDYSATGLPDGLEIDSLTGVVSGAASEGSSGQYVVRAIADDGRGGVTAVTFSWFVIVPGGGTDQVTVNFEEFSEGDAWQLNGDASLFEGLLRVTDNLPNQEATAFWKTPLFLTPDSSFSARFDFRIHGSDNGADGMTFLMQANGDTAFGGTGEGSGLGFNGISSSVGIEIDTQDGSGDPSPNHVAVIKEGNTFQHLASHTPVFDLEDEDAHTLWVDYDGEADRLEIYLSQATTTSRPDDPVVTLSPIDVYELVGSQAWIGFTAATGSVRNAHDVQNLWFSLNSSGGLPAELRLTGPGTGQPGETNLYTVTGATAGNTVYFIGSPVRGSVPIPGCPGVDIGLSQPRLMGAETADAAGEATFSLFVPDELSGASVHIQAIELNACGVSNVDETVY